MIEKIKLEKGERLELLTIGDDQGNKNFLYLFITEKNYAAMSKVIEAGEKFNPEDYGVVYLQGVGEAPPPEFEKLLSGVLSDKWVSEQN